MKEPTRYSMSTGEPVKEDTNKIPMPRLYPDSMSDDLYSPLEDKEFINWEKEKQYPKNENNSQSYQT